MNALLDNAVQRAVRYLEGLDGRAVAPSAEAVSRLSVFQRPLQEEPISPMEVLRELDEVGSPATIATAGPRFFGFVIGGSLPVALAANWLAGAWDQNSALYNVTPATAVVEDVALHWLAEMLGLPPECGGAFVTGTSVAHLAALAAARHAILARMGWNAEADGLFGAPPIEIIASEEAHPTLLKAIALLGMGRNRVTKIPADSNGAMLFGALPPLNERTIVCVQAGNVNTGAVDPISDICVAAKAAGAWVHVDGAFGLWAAAAPSLSHLVEGCSLADSWATDCHKWLNVPYDSGVAFVRNANALRAAMSITADYLPTASEHRNPADYTPELSRRARGVDCWAALRSLGKSGVADLVERTCRHARRFAGAMQSAGYDVLNEVVLNQVLVSFGAPESTLQIVRDIQAEGTCWCGSTVWQGRTAMRFSVISWATTDADVQRSIDAILGIASRYRKPTHV